ncbi:hypothetical protein GMDG_04027 [Pseudogymnoascus destructans 20631-21]|uniref:Uncharacterized protein n=1 Tax=Pseudogymnoascus destructans (strain ATCC MYA-4855 / 20631-21) TaxID=658429 RepID=L8G8X5_PSED2|nr:hypothetical protein GMDG_04027 [Pseudogymnoascus destructans 20631-21]
MYLHRPIVLTEYDTFLPPDLVPWTPVRPLGFDEDAGLAADSEATVQAINVLHRIYSSRPRIRESLDLLRRRKSLGFLRSLRVMLTIPARLSYITPRALWSWARRRLKVSRPPLRSSTLLSGLEEYVNNEVPRGAPHRVMPVMPSPIDLECALLERRFVKPSKWKFNTPLPAPPGPPSVLSLSSGDEGAIPVSLSSSSESESSLSSSSDQGSD